MGFCTIFDGCMGDVIPSIQQHDETTQDGSYPSRSFRRSFLATCISRIDWIRVRRAPRERTPDSFLLGSTFFRVQVHLLVWLTYFGCVSRALYAVSARFLVVFQSVGLYSSQIASLVLFAVSSKHQVTGTSSWKDAHKNGLWMSAASSCASLCPSLGRVTRTCAWTDPLSSSCWSVTMEPWFCNVVVVSPTLVPGAPRSLLGQGRPRTRSDRPRSPPPDHT